MSVGLFELEFLSADHLRDLFRSVFPLKEQISVTQAYDNLRSLAPCSPERFENTIHLLQELHLLKVHDDQTLSPAHHTGTLSDAEIDGRFGQALLKGLEGHGILNELCSAAQYSDDGTGVIVDSRILPWRYRNLRPLLTAIGFFVRRSIHDQHWEIAQYAQNSFLNALRFRNRETVKFDGMSPTELAAMLEKQIERGAAAERWVLAHEQKRLKRHPLYDQIALISEISVSAGYDIASFSTVRALTHDRFIEVKSFSGIPSFYWSKGEVDAARRLGEAYALCLVDRARMDEGGYEPTFIFEPYRRLFVEPQSQWDFQTDSYFISKRRDSAGDSLPEESF